MWRALNALLDQGLYIVNEEQLYHFVNIYAKSTNRTWDYCIKELKHDVNNFIKFMRSNYGL